ncbi:MAG: hypothetical protein ACYTGS_18475 [Planctomycetota bacterium]|jgi:hypothetical protein
MKIFAFEATTHSRRDVTVVEVADRFQSRFAVDTVESGSLPSAIRVFNQRHTVKAFGKERPKYNVISKAVV